MKELYSKKIYYILFFFAILLVCALGKVASAFFIPVVVSVLLSCVFYPIVKNLNKKAKIPWIIGTLVMVLIIVIIIALLSTIITTSLHAFVSQYPKYENRFFMLYKMYASAFNLKFDEQLSFLENLFEQFKSSSFMKSSALTLSGDIIKSTKNIGIVLLFSAFLLLEMRLGKEKVNAMFNNDVNGRVIGVTKKIVTETVRFLSIKFFISLVTGILVFLCCLIVRIDFAVMWAFLAFVMNFIPTFGSIFSVGLTTIFAILQFYPSAWQPIFIFISMVLINFALGNIVEPRIEGDNLGLSPFVILVSLTFWGWMWGFVGMILAVPLMVIVKIICENVSFMHPLAILIGNRPKDVQKEFEK